MLYFLVEDSWEHLLKGGADPDNVAANRKCCFLSHLFKLTNRLAAIG